jgi:hypothetical protein
MRNTGGIAAPTATNLSSQKRPQTGLFFLRDGQSPTLYTPLCERLRRTAGTLIGGVNASACHHVAIRKFRGASL